MNHLEGSWFLRFANSLNESSRSQSLNVAIPQTGGGRAIPEELERVIGDIVIDVQNRRHVDDLEVSPEVIEGDERLR